MKTLLSILLGLMLFTSLVGISYATPIVQPAQDTGNNSCIGPYQYQRDCHSDPGSHVGNDPYDHHHHHGCYDQKSPDGSCGCESVTIGPDGCGCIADITPHSFEVSDIHADTSCTVG